MKTSLQTAVITPVNASYTNKNDKFIEQYKTTLLRPVAHKLVADGAGSMSVEQINAVLSQCAENSQEVEIEFTSDRDRYNNLTYSIFSIKPIPKKNPTDTKL